MNYVLKLLIVLLVTQFSFSYIDQPCDGGSNGKGVCVLETDCIMYSGQKGSAIAYAGSAPNWPCPNDPNDVICCVKTLTQLKDGTATNGRCLNINECSGSTIDTAECPGSDNVKLCVSGLFGTNIIRNIMQNSKNNLNLYIAFVSILIIILFIIILLMK